MTLKLTWADATRIDYALGYRIDISRERVPRNMTRASPVKERAAEYFIESWEEDTWEIMVDRPVEVGVQVAGTWYLWTLWNTWDFFTSVRTIK